MAPGGSVVIVVLATLCWSLGGLCHHPRFPAWLPVLSDRQNAPTPPRVLYTGMKGISGPPNLARLSETVRRHQASSDITADLIHLPSRFQSLLRIKKLLENVAHRIESLASLHSDQK